MSMATVRIRTEGADFVELVRTEDAAWADYDEIGLEVSIRASTFQVWIPVTVDLNGLREFSSQVDELHRFERDAVQFRSNNLDLTFTLCEGGHISLEGEARDPSRPSNRLLFGMMLDQSFLPEVAKGFLRLVEDQS